MFSKSRKVTPKLSLLFLCLFFFSVPFHSLMYGLEKQRLKNKYLLKRGSFQHFVKRHICTIPNALRGSQDVLVELSLQQLILMLEML